jgi:hypothetical protein
MVDEPDWDSLKALLAQAERWMLFDDECGPLNIEPVALLYNMLFASWDNVGSLHRAFFIRGYVASNK